MTLVTFPVEITDSFGWATTKPIQIFFRPQHSNTGAEEKGTQAPNAAGQSK